MEKTVVINPTVLSDLCIFIRQNVYRTSDLKYIMHLKVKRMFYVITSPFNDLTIHNGHQCVEVKYSSKNQYYITQNECSELKTMLDNVEPEWTSNLFDATSNVISLLRCLCEEPMTKAAR